MVTEGNASSVAGLAGFWQRGILNQNTAMYNFKTNGFRRSRNYLQRGDGRVLLPVVNCNDC